MTKLVKVLIIVVCCVFLFQLVIYVSQILSARTSIEDMRSYMLRSVNEDTGRLHAFSQTKEFRRMYLTQSKDSLQLFYNKYANTPPRYPIVPIKTTK